MYFYYCCCSSCLLTKIPTFPQVLLHAIQYTSPTFCLPSSLLNFMLGLLAAKPVNLDMETEATLELEPKGVRTCEHTPTVESQVRTVPSRDEVTIIERSLIPGINRD